MNSKRDFSRDCSSITEGFLVFWLGMGRYLREKILLEVRPGMALEATCPILPKASNASRISPRRKSSGGRAIIDDAGAPGVDTGRIGCGRPSGRCTIWAIRCPDGRESWKSPIRNITVPPVDTISTPICWIWPCPTPITPIG